MLANRFIFAVAAVNLCILVAEGVYIVIRALFFG